MNRIDINKKVFDYLDSIEKPFDKDSEIEIFRWVLNMIEDYMSWKDIFEHLQKGCNFEELKGEEARRALKEESEQ